MEQIFYLLTLETQKPMCCKVLKEKKLKQPGMSLYLHELEKPNPNSTYKFRKNEPQSFSKLHFYPHVAIGKYRTTGQPYGKIRPLRGTIGFCRDEKKTSLAYNLPGDARVLLCVSKKQAKEWVRILKTLNKRFYRLDFGARKPSRDCRLFKQYVFQGDCNYWLTEVNPPLSSKEYGLPGEEILFSKVSLALNDFPIPIGKPFPVTVCFTGKKIKIAPDEAWLYPKPQKGESPS